MYFSEGVKSAVAKAPKTLGNQLGRWMVHHNFSVTRVSKATGAVRQSVYNWMLGGAVTNAYQDRVKVLLQILRAAPNAEQAWRTACEHFGIKG